jgi:PleD family two-component response regulator
MSNVLIADANGRRRVQLEVLLQGAGHHTYSVGTIAEAMRYAEIYVPDILIAPESLPDGDIAAIVSAFRSSERQMLRELPIVTARKILVTDVNITQSQNNTAREFVVAAEAAILRVGVLT